MAVFFANGCGSDCEKTNPENEVRYKGGSVTAGCTEYETSGWAGPLLHFPPGRRFVIEHRLGRVPVSLDTYLSFSERGLSDANNVSESAGNQLVIETVDATVVQVRNDSCAEFYLRLVAHASSDDAGGAVCDAGVGDGG